MGYGKMKKYIVTIFFVICGAFLSGCSTAELENRNFPLAVGVDMDGRDCRISYKFQNLSKVADTNTSGGQSTDYFIRSESFFTGLSEYSNDSNKIMDYNHVKVLVLGEDFLENREVLENFIEVCERDNLIAYNTLLFLAEDAGSILALDENLDTSIGSYLEEMIESRKDYTLKDAVTVGDLYKEYDNKNQTLFVPILKEEGGMPVIRNYYVISQFIPGGEVSVEEAVLSYLCQGKLKKLSFSMEDGTNVDIQSIRAKGRITKKYPLQLNISIRLEAKILNSYGKSEEDNQKLKTKISKKFTDSLNKAAGNLKSEPDADITNSYNRLGRYSRWAYRTYNGNPGSYLADLQPVFEIRTVLVEEK